MVDNAAGATEAQRSMVRPFRTIPIQKAVDPTVPPISRPHTTSAPPARTDGTPYRAYQPAPFTPDEREHVTLLFGGLHWRVERLIQGVLENLGYRAEILPTATTADLATGRELADIGQCCPTSFTTGNLANFLRAETARSDASTVSRRYVYVTAGSCGACRFGQYHQSYELALRGIGLGGLRMFLLGQDGVDQGAAPGGGLQLNLPLMLGIVWAVMLADVVQDLEYRVRPFEVEPGATERASRAAIEELYQSMRARPRRGTGVGSALWHLATGYFAQSMRRARRHFDAVELDRLRVKPIVKITGEFYLQTAEGDPNHHIHRWLENEGAEVYPAAITVWLDYLMRLAVQDHQDRIGIRPRARVSAAAVGTAQALLRHTHRRFCKSFGGAPRQLPPQAELRRLAAPWFHSRLNGGEGDMLVGKALWAHQQKKAHMICELSPYSCMPNTMSIGAMAGVLGRHPDLLYAPIEIKGDAEVHALSRCQMILTEARQRAQREYDAVLARIGRSEAELRAIAARHPTLSPRDHADPAPRCDRQRRELRTSPGVARMIVVGLDVGSTTVKAAALRNGTVVWQDYTRHHTKQCDTVLAFMKRLEADCGFMPGRDRVYVTGSGGGLLAPLIGAKFVQEVVAVAACVERLHPDVNFVSEIGGEDMKTLFFTASGDSKSKQVFMQSACSGGTGTFVEKTARKLHITSEQLAQMPYAGLTLHKISAKCGIFAEADANTLVKSGVPVEEIIASLFEAVVHQNLATLTKGNMPRPGVLLLGGPNLFFRGLREAWLHHLGKLWAERGVELPEGASVESLVQVPKDALYYACLGCAALADGEPPALGIYAGTTRLQAWIETGQWEEKAKLGSGGLLRENDDLPRFLQTYAAAPSKLRDTPHDGPTVVGCDFGSTTAKAVVIDAEGGLLFDCYVPSAGNPIEDAKNLFGQLRAAGFERIDALALTGYGKDLLRDILGADVAVVETVAHATAALHYYPDADVICDVGGCDVKIMILRQGTVSDFRLNSQCSSGNGAFLQGVAERYDVPLANYAERAFAARAMPALAMGCGVFLQSDIVNQQRKGWSADEILASLAAVLPLNVWVYAGQLQNLAAAGRKFVLQGGTHRNLAVVKAQVDFITAKVPDAEVVVHPYSGEAGAIGAALVARDAFVPGRPSRFRGHDVIARLEQVSTTSEDTVCHWCAVNCRRTFIDVRVDGGRGRAWSKVALAEGWERVISGNTCPKGLLEDANEMKVAKAALEEARDAHPNMAEVVRSQAFRSARLNVG